MRYQTWNVKAPNQEELASLRREGFPALSALVLCARGMGDLEKAREFLAMEEAPDPFLLRDMDRAVARISQALEQGETIAVYGDYDVDGITSTCLLTQYLTQRGGQVIPYIPKRIEEGYGLNPEAIEHLAKEGVTLIVTVDCGVTAVAEATVATQLGVDLVITDHHTCGETLPEAVAVVNPRREDCPYPFKALAGVGVALKLALALTPPDQREACLLEFADLAAVGTVADVMSLTGENRSLVRRGLESLARNPRPGLEALLHEAGVKIEGNKPLSADRVGYFLAPRLNAAGRLGQTDLAAELLMTRSPARAKELSMALCALNRERQALESDIFESCINRLEREGTGKRRAIVLAGEDWHQGVVGIVASRLSERFSCPTFMISLQDGKGKGSCRSYGGLHLFQALHCCSSHLEGFGGHAMAAGFTILEEQVTEFRSAIEQWVEEVTQGEPLASDLGVDARLDDPGLLTVDEVLGLDALEPFGAGNPKPLFCMTGCTISALSEVGGGKHLKLRLTKGDCRFDGIFFSQTAAGAQVAGGDRVDVAFTPQINEYRGHRSVQLLLTDIRPATTRMEAEQALYERLRRGDPISAREAADLIPSRDEFVAVWRYLSQHARPHPVEDTARRLAKNVARAYGTKETVMRTMVCLDVFSEHSLIGLEQRTDHLRISLRNAGDKVDLESSQLLRRLRHMAHKE